MLKEFLCVFTLIALGGCATAPPPAPRTSRVPTPTPLPTPSSSNSPSPTTVTPIVSSSVGSIYRSAGIAVVLNDYSPPKAGPQIRDDPPSGSTAAIAGLRAGDLLISLNNQPVKNRCAVKSILSMKNPRERVSIEIERNGQQFRGSIVLEELESLKGCD